MIFNKFNKVLFEKLILISNDNLNNVFSIQNNDLVFEFTITEAAKKCDFKVFLEKVIYNSTFERMYFLMFNYLIYKLSKSKGAKSILITISRIQDSKFEVAPNYWFDFEILFNQKTYYLGMFDYQVYKSNECLERIEYNGEDADFLKEFFAIRKSIVA